MCPIPLYPIPPAGLIGHVPHTPCTHPPCTALPLWVSLPMYPIPLYPIAPCVPIAHRPHCRCDPYPMYTIALITYVAHYPLGTGVMGHMGNSVQGVWGTGV